MSEAFVALEVRRLAKRYGEVRAVEDVTFDARAGEVFALLGRNGAGKTTTLECILGLRRPDSGDIKICGVDAASAPDAARALVGAQLQSSALQEKITPRQALALFRSFYRDAAAIPALLAEFQLEEKADTAFEALSGGQKQRLFLALAFVHRPKVVVLDEPSAGLDPQTRRELHQLLRRVTDRGVAVVLSTHDLVEAEAVAQRVGILHGGRLVAVGAPSELVARSAAAPWLRVRSSKPLPAFAAGDLVGVTTVERQENEAHLQCADVNAALASVAAALTAAGAPIDDISLEQPTLEDVFFEACGTRWEAES